MKNTKLPTLRKVKYIWAKSLLNYITHRCKNNLVEIKEEHQPFTHYCKVCGEPSDKEYKQAGL